MTETFSPYSKLFLGLKVLILPPLLSYSGALMADDTGLGNENVLLITQGVLIFVVEVLTLLITGWVNEYYRKKAISKIKAQISDIKSLQSDGLEAGNDKVANQHLTKLERDLMKLTVASN